uniref:Sen15 domain-containing protein n=1 Tax=Heterorhabditis bacteriophora TaxID=37862 RepID=A0A1I7XLZ2_HETBA
MSWAKLDSYLLFDVFKADLPHDGGYFSLVIHSSSTHKCWISLTLYPRLQDICPRDLIKEIRCEFPNISLYTCQSPLLSFLERDAPLDPIYIELIILLDFNKRSMGSLVLEAAKSL